MRATETKRQRQRATEGFTVIELLITVIVVGILALMGLAKYQDFAEKGRRKTCLYQLQSIENALATWESRNVSFAPEAHTAWGHTPVSGHLGPPEVTSVDGGKLLVPNHVPPALSPIGAPSQFFGRPMAEIIKDDKVWSCPSALKRYYGGEVQNLTDDYMRPEPKTAIGVELADGSSNVVGLFGRYGMVVAGSAGGGIDNRDMPKGWITPASTPAGQPAAADSPQAPFSIALCGNYGTFGGEEFLPGADTSGAFYNPVTGESRPGTLGFEGARGGGPVGPDGSPFNRHSARW